MRIGILTFHCARNFGAMLQCYALQEYLSSCGHDVSVIDYRPEYMDCAPPKFKWWYLKPTSPLLSLKRLLKIFPSLKRRHELFSSFENRFFRLSEPVDKSILEKPLSEYDCVIVGSDQIWNPRHNAGDSVWYGEIGGGVKLIAYAASAGAVDSKSMVPLKDALQRFAAISVRENELSQAIGEQCHGLLPEVVCDPVFLPDNDFWSQWAEPVYKGAYILVYQARSNDAIIRIAKEIAAKYNAEVLTVDCYSNSFARGIRHVDAGPDGFVSLVRNALCVVTSSFHGASMSMIMHTPFYVVRLDDGADARAEECLARMGLSERMIGMRAVPDHIEMDFHISDQLIAAEREKSRMFIEKALESCI